MPKSLFESIQIWLEWAKENHPDRLSACSCEVLLFEFEEWYRLNGNKP